ncbi:DUF6493 family protein [Nocardioides lianchengensis]|uniref:Secreted protein n=1 Tax=Nocardioides lianchengensis TaxID=1045774 RepID=A0A1G6PUV8_9ACTN|nr:DUF6493 family protein [Nocardioides lianchengensis]NYG11967.1 hypothetical protein [Nocardioides lianchengensis]SDC83145.1 hypothetical protein SAMN05421872_104135 [Nocardioides lianchengensis]
MSAPTLDELVPLMAARDLAPLVARLDDLDDAGRKTLVKPVRALSRSGEWGDAPRHLARGLAVVGPAVLPDARSTTAWVRRFAGWPTDDQDVRFDRYGNRLPSLSLVGGAVVEVLVRRAPTWLPALVDALAERLRFNPYDPDDYLLIESLRTRIGLPPPAVPVFVAAWIDVAWSPSRDGSDPVDLVRAEPAYAALVPLALEVDEIAGVLSEGGQLRRLADSGAVDRDGLIDAALARLQRGGRPQATNDVVRVLDSLDPTPDEVAARVRGYLVLLPPGSATSVATVAQRDLQRQHAEGLLRADDVLEMSRSVFARTDKKVLRAQLKHLAAHARSVPADADLVARAACAALDNAAPDVQRGAVDLLVRLAPGLSAAVVAEVAAAGEGLPGDLHLRLGSGLPAAEAVPAPPLPAPPVATLPGPPAPVGPVLPITSVDELVEELASIVRSEPLRARGADLDRVVEALPRLAGADRDGLRQAATTITQSGTYAYYREHASGFDFGTRCGLVVLLASCLGDAWGRPAPDPHLGRRPGPERAITERLFSLAQRIRTDGTVRVVALPSTLDGAITASDLLDRLATAAAQGWTPDELDLEQALLRLDPSAADPALFEALGGDAAARVARWIRSGGRRTPVGVRGRAPEPAVESLEDPPVTGLLWERLSRWTVPRKGQTAGWDPGAAFDTWPLVLPHHRDIVAAHLLRELSRARDSRCQGLGALVDLTEGSGPVGNALLVGLAYAAAGKHQDAWSAAADGLLVLAGRRQLDGAAFGEVLATMVERGDIVAKRLVTPLGDAARAGAAVEIWPALAGVLRPLLTGTATGTGLVDLLVLGAEVAPLAGARGTVEGLDALAERRGSSRQVVEARRLREILRRPVG